MITPIELIDNIYYKRDDYFKPFGDYHVNGGKVRQALIMFEKYLDDIQSKHNNGVITAGAVHSPQSANIAKVAELHEVKCITCVGGTKPENLDNHHMMRLTKHYGCEIKIVLTFLFCSAISFLLFKKLPLLVVKKEKFRACKDTKKYRSGEVQKLLPLFSTTKTVLVSK